MIFDLLGQCARRAKVLVDCLIEFIVCNHFILDFGGILVRLFSIRYWQEKVDKMVKKSTLPFSLEALSSPDDLDDELDDELDEELDDELDDDLNTN